MSRNVVLEDTGFGLRAAVLDGGRLVEVRDADHVEPRVSEALFAARVTAVDPKLNAAFLDCGLARAGLIVAKDARAAAGATERRPIRELVREGQRLIVQGLREPAGDKGARFTSDLKLFGMALVHTPLTTMEGGRRAADPRHERARELFPEGHFALRQHAMALDDEALRAEAAVLARRWERLQAAARAATKPGRLPEPESALERLLRGLLDPAPAVLAAGDGQVVRALEQLAASATTLPPMEIRRLPGGGSAFARAGIEDDLAAALAPEVALPGGGRLVIETTAACVAIDVDGGGRAPLEVDLAATAEIARQVRLRNLGGSIVVDFVDLPHKQERHRLEESLKRAFRHDPAPVEIHAMSALGIVQISRARRGEPLASRLQVRCRCCGGRGHEASPRAGAEALLRELAAAVRPAAAIRLSGELKRFLETEGAEAWRRAVERLGAAPPLVIDPSLPAAGFALEADRHDR